MTLTEQWLWKMNYCKERNNPPAQKWAWDLAEKALQAYMRIN